MGSEQSTESSVQGSFTSECSPEGLQYTSSPDDDFRDLRPRYLDKFIAEQLQPDEAFRTLVSTALDRLCLYLQHHMRPPTVKRLIKGGSMGKGTALKGRSDLDCILIMNGVSDARDLKEKIDGILAQLQRILEKDPLSQYCWKIRIIRVNSFMVKMEMEHFHWNEIVEVDILPTFDADVYDDYSRNHLYNLMAKYHPETREFCSAALAELKRDFIKPKPAKLKNLIRLVKHWCKTYIPWEYGQPRIPNSYLLELLTIHVWENAGSPSSFTTALLFKDVIVTLHNHRQLDIKWDEYYNNDRLQCMKPRIIDPANPYNNVYDVVGDWQKVQRVVRETLQMPLFENYDYVLDAEDHSSEGSCIIT